jgi:hypothetical protein
LPTDKRPTSYEFLFTRFCFQKSLQKVENFLKIDEQSLIDCVSPYWPLAVEDLTVSHAFASKLPATTAGFNFVAPLPECLFLFLSLYYEIIRSMASRSRLRW